MTMLKEKNIVNHIVSNWNKYFPDIDFWKTEFSLRNFRIDIAASMQLNLKDIGLRDEDYILERAPIFFEVKYNSNMRDLMFELQKQISFRNWYSTYGKAFCMICVISDEFDEDMVKFMIDNSINMFKIDITDDNLDEMTITEYRSFDDIEVTDVYKK